jgi:hypothetical protein
MQSIEIEIAGVIMNVDYTLEYDGGYMYDSDGHGEPPSCEFSIENIFLAGVDITELVECYAPQILKAIEEHIFENR